MNNLPPAASAQTETSRSFRPIAFLLAAFLALIANVARADLDSDGDGLSDNDEIQIYSTFPNTADTDRDGLPDGLEVQMGTDPRDPNSVLRMLPQVRLANGGWRVCWTSKAGQSYQLQSASLTNISGGGFQWRTISNVTATGGTTCIEDRSIAASAYRVLLSASTNNDALPPILSLINASQPLAPPMMPSSHISVVARDLVGVTRVEILDGAAILGGASRGANNSWTFNWPLNLNLNGRHYLRARAHDAAGNIGFSPTLLFDVNITSAQRCVNVGAVSVCADSVVLSNGVHSFSGHIRVNGVNLSANSTLTATATAISGSGGVLVPGLGTVATGGFDLNPATGWLTMRAGASFPGVSFNSRLRFNATQLSVNVWSNSICGSGSVVLQVPNHVFGSATFTGTVCYQPRAATVTVAGTLAMGGFAGTGTATLQLSDSTFTLAGDARLISANGEVYTVNNGVARLSFAGALPNVAVQGRLGFPEGLALQIQGNIRADGSANLSALGAGPINGYRFTLIQCEITRPPGLTAVITNVFKGRLAHANLLNYTLEGTVLSTGFLDASGTGDATFGGFTFRPFNIRAVGNVFSNQVNLEVRGSLALNYLERIDFQGSLKTSGALEVTGQSGPYTLATFNGLVPNLNDPAVSFEKKVFAGAYHLLSRNSAVSTMVNFTVAGNTNTSSYTLDATAVTTCPGFPTLTLAGRAATSGELRLSGALANQRTTVWGHSVDGLRVSAAHSAAGLFTFEVAGSTLNYSPLGCQIAQGSGAIASDGSGSIRFTATACTIGGYPLQTAIFDLTQSASGEHSLAVSGTLAVPALGTTVSVSGALRSDGTYALSGRVSTALTLRNLPVTMMAANAAVSLTESGLTIRGDVSGGVLLRVPVVVPMAVPPMPPSIPAIVNISPAGVVTMTGCVTVSPIASGQFRLQSTAPGGNFTACFGPNGLEFPENAQLYYRGLPLSLPALPKFTASVNGSFSLEVTAAMTAGVTLNRHELPSLRFTLTRTIAVMAAQNVVATIRVPGSSAGFTAAADFNLSGALNSDGTFHLTGQGNGGLVLAGLPAGAVDASLTGSVSFRESGLTLTGNLSGGILDQVPTQPSAATGGLLAEYFDNPDFTGNKITRIDGTIDFDWGNGQPDASIGADGFSVRWAGWLRPEFSENYTFTTQSDDGVRLWVNNQLLIDNWTDHAPTDNSASIALQGGRPCEIRMEYYENGGGAVARLDWASPSRPREIVPSSRMSQTSPGLGISGTLQIAANGRMTLAGCVTVAPLVLGQFRLESTQPDGRFTACFGPDGLTFPRGARLLYRGAALTLPELPEFTVSARGDFNIDVAASMTAGVGLNGFGLPDFAFTVRRSGGVTVAHVTSAKLTLPAANGGLAATATVNVQGSLNSDGTFSLTATTDSGLALNNLPVATVAAGASVRFTEAGLQIAGAVSGGVLNTVPVVSAEIVLAIANNGAASISGSVSCPALVDNLISFEPMSGGNFTALLNNSGLRFSGAQLRVGGVFSAAIALPGVTLAADGRFDLPVNASVPGGFTIKGYGFTRVSFHLVRSGNRLAITPFSASLTVSGFNVDLGGSIDRSGNVTLDGSGAFRLAGFPVANGQMSLRNASLSARGTLGVVVNGATLGNVNVDLPVSPSGTYDASFNASFWIGGHVTDTFSLNVSNSRLTGAANLNYGGKWVRLPSLSITPSCVLAGGTVPVDSGWMRFLDAPGGDTGDVYGRLQGALTLNVGCDGRVTASLSATFGWWAVIWKCDPANCYWVDPPGHWENGPFGTRIWIDPPPYWHCEPPNCYNVSVPPNIVEAQSGTVSGSVGSDGRILVSENHEGQNGFQFDLW